MFSKIDICSQMPVRGSWNSRAIIDDRRWICHLVRSTSPSRTLPRSGISSPARILSSVDLPAPFEPIMVTNWPFGTDEIDSAQRRHFERRALVEGDRDAFQDDHAAAFRLPSDLPIGANSASATKIAVTRFTSEALRPRKSVLSANAIAMR